MRWEKTVYVSYGAISYETSSESLQLKYSLTIMTFTQYVFVYSYYWQNKKQTANVNKVIRNKTKKIFWIQWSDLDLYILFDLSRLNKPCSWYAPYILKSTDRTINHKSPFGHSDRQRDWLAYNYHYVTIKTNQTS